MHPRDSPPPPCGECSAGEPLRPRQPARSCSCRRIPTSGPAAWANSTPDRPRHIDQFWHRCEETREHVRRFCVNSGRERCEADVTRFSGHRADFCLCPSTGCICRAMVAGMPIDRQWPAQEFMATPFHPSWYDRDRSDLRVARFLEACALDAACRADRHDAGWPVRSMRMRRCAPGLGREWRDRCRCKTRS